LGNELVIDQGADIYTIDTGYQRKGLVASHLIHHKGRYAFIDVGTSSCLHTIRLVMSIMKIRPKQVDYVMVTHVHLDHAGAAGTLMQELPQAQLVVHPRGARHMIDPAKLIAGATAVYGEERMAYTFGDILPVAADRVIEATDEMTLSLNGRELLFLDTPGHARHHYCVFDELSQGFFTGDTFGLAYSPLAVNGRSFVFPTTTPVQFDPDAMHASIDRLMSFKPEKMFLTHFGCLPDPEQAASQLHQYIDSFVSIANNIEVAETSSCMAELRKALQAYLIITLRDFGCQMPEQDILPIMNMDLDLNAQGLCYWLQQKNQSA
jgi:glyoxylase-like metal-dependent hydrolase (beta-lactamase superfamily II)